MKAVKDNETKSQNNDQQEQGVKEAGVYVEKVDGFIVLELRVPPPSQSLGFKLTIEQALAVARAIEFKADELAAESEQETELEPIEVVE